MLLEFQERRVMAKEWWSFAKKGDSVWVTHISSTEVCMSTQEWKSGVEIKRMIDLVLVKMDMLRYVQEVRVVGGMGRGPSDHYFVLRKVRLIVA